MSAASSAVDWGSKPGNQDQIPSWRAILRSGKKRLVCYCWISGIAEVAQVVFVRKRMVEVQYLRTSITDQQGEEFGELRIFWKTGGIIHPGRPGAKKLCS